MTSGTKKYDVIVVGGGAGTKLVRPVAARGLQVAVIEKEKMGGTCLNRGCIPSKMLIQAADVAYWANKAREYHIHVAIQNIDFPKIVEEVNVTVDEEAGNIPPQYEKNPNIHLYQAAGKFISENGYWTNKTSKISYAKIVELKEKFKTIDNTTLIKTHNNGNY